MANTSGSPISGALQLDGVGNSPVEVKIEKVASEADNHRLAAVQLNSVDPQQNLRSNRNWKILCWVFGLVTFSSDSVFGSERPERFPRSCYLTLIGLSIVLQILAVYCVIGIVCIACLKRTGRWTGKLQVAGLVFFAAALLFNSLTFVMEKYYSG